LNLSRMTAQLVCNSVSFDVKYDNNPINLNEKSDVIS
jgi:hypothetical protein